MDPKNPLFGEGIFFATFRILSLYLMIIKDMVIKVMVMGIRVMDMDMMTIRVMDTKAMDMDMMIIRVSECRKKNSLTEKWVLWVHSM